MALTLNWPSMLQLCWCGGKGEKKFNSSLEGQLCYKGNELL